MIKKPLKIFFASILLLSITIAFLLSDYNPIYQNDEFIHLRNKLKEAKNEDLSRFVKIQNEIYKKIEDPKCPCEIATNYIGSSSLYRHGYSPTQSLYRLKIERKYSKIDCFKFLLLNTDFKHPYSNPASKTFGVKEASKFYFKKNINELNENEILTLIAMLKNPSLYDPIRNKEIVKNRVRMLERILHK